MRGVKYDCEFQTKNGTITYLKNEKMSKLLPQIENLLKVNYNINDRISNQTIYNLQYRPKNASRILRLFIKVNKTNIV